MRRAKAFLLRGAFAFGGKLERHLAVSPDNDKPMPRAADEEALERLARVASHTAREYLAATRRAQIGPIFLNGGT